MSLNVRGISVCVEYSDIFGLTLPYNLHHFSDLMVVTSPDDIKTLDLVSDYIEMGHKIRLYVTDAFYRSGAKFNKWLALEEALDTFGREGAMCVFDADILFPKHTVDSQLFFHTESCLVTPHRRMYRQLPASFEELPEEENWSSFQLGRNRQEWSGYCHIFHADDPCCIEKPWYQTDWSHAGGADSVFQSRWQRDSSWRVRPGFEVLHIGEPATNWCGRVSDFSDGSKPEKSLERRQALRAIFDNRSGTYGKSRHLSGPNIYVGTDFSAEKIRSSETDVPA